MKLKNWKEKFDKENPKLQIRSISVEEFLKLEFDNQPERLSEKTSKEEAIV